MHGKQLADRLQLRLVRAVAAGCVLLACVGAGAQGRLLATGGVTTLEGAAGGGLVAWSLIAGYGTRDEVGATAFVTAVPMDDFRLRSVGAAIGIKDRVEISYAAQRFDLGSTVPGASIRMDVFGAKVRVVGDAVFDQDRWWPQVAVGAQHKINRDFTRVPEALGARDASGTDVYVSATKLYLAALEGRNVLVDLTLRATRANQLGLLGFGGDANDRYRVKAEGSVALFVTDALAVGGEYRAKPDNLTAFREDRFADLFVAWWPSRNLAVVGGYAWLGNVADKPAQNGWYLSLQGSL